MATSERDAARRSSHYLKYLVYYPRGGYILAGNEKTRPSFFEKKKKEEEEDPRIFSFSFFLSLSLLFNPQNSFHPPRAPFFPLPIHAFSLSLLERLYSSTSQYLSQCRVTEERINMYRETCCHFKARTAVAFILSSRRYVHEGNAPLGKVDTYVQWNSI